MWWEEGRHGHKDKISLGLNLALMLFISSVSLLHFSPSPPHCFPPPPLLLHIDGHLTQTVQILYWGEIKYLIMLGEEERDVISSECSSGCQSGWTAYLDNSSCAFSLPLEHKKGDSLLEEEEEEEEEDSSMVSDASSGPPHFPEQDKLSLHCINSRTCFEGNDLVKCGNGKKRKVEPEQQYQEHCSSLLDDTASSPLVSQPKASFISEDISSYMKTPMEGDLEFSCGYSATHFERNYTPEKANGLPSIHFSRQAKTYKTNVKERKWKEDLKRLTLYPLLCRRNRRMNLQKSRRDLV
ncbi:uncharacterized protein LOC122033666 isoform X1 [Zingiber officinale]|uniref:uncharacterized protein LOC122033666 isoform X1 n=1 Tax=Zingiber officinale TaxID=94328 RepID=UPI001C4D6F7F|nr:uncharacterized protein LOC122033666 isoform X1 [Zingiber officinale]